MLGALVRRRLSARIAALSLGVLLLVQVAVLAVTRHGIDRAAREQLVGELDHGASAWAEQLQQRARQADLVARMAARDFGFQRTLLNADADADTVASAMESLVTRAEAALAAYVSNDGEVRATLSETAGEGAVAEVAKRLARGRGERGVHVIDGRPYYVVATELLAPTRSGWLMLGYPVDRDMLARLQQLAGVEAAIVAGEGAARRLLIASRPLPPEVEAALVGGAGEVEIGADTLLVRRESLGRADVLLLRSIDAATRPYLALEITLAVISLLALLGAGAVSVFGAARVTTPLRSLVRAAERLRQGRYDEPLRHVAREDEIGELALSFDEMRVGIAEREDRIRRLAYADPLTGLPNRAAFTGAVQQAIAEGAGADGRLAVAILNLNRFKPVNDALGYQLGDRLLCAVADLLRAQQWRAEDMIARLGGDEFALLLPGADEASAVRTIERLAEAFKEPRRLHDQTVDLSAAFGVACWPEHAERADALLSRAEIAMHAAKQRTDLWAAYRSAMDPDSATTLSLLSELRDAVARDELRLYLQPKFALDGRMVGAEALVRWQHPVRGLVPPMAFIPFAEKTGFVRELTKWIFDDAARCWPMLAAAGLERVSVNLSALDLMDRGLPRALEATLARRGVGASAFCLEITESAIMGDPKRAQVVLQELKALGFKISIDDFGEGYTCLQHLRHLPVDELKVDGIFVKKMDEVPKDESVVRSVVDLAHNLGLSVVAEGVENAEVWRRLKGMGCDEAQGYLMCRPLPADELPAFGRRWTEGERARVAA